MNLSPGLHLRQQQKLVMTPMLQQALKILQLNNLELTELVQQELSENPLLEEAEPGGVVEPEEAPPVEDADHPTASEEPVLDMDAISRETPLSESSDSSEPSEVLPEPSTPEIDITERTAPPDDQWEDYFTDAGTQEGFTRENGNPDRDPWATIASRRPSLQQHLWTQLEDRELAPPLRRAAEAILGGIDERGYLAAGLESLASPGLDSPQLFAAMRLVQGFDPPGVAARDLRECLLLQLEARGRKHSLAWRIVSDHLEKLKDGPRPSLAAVLSVEEAEVVLARREIASLEPVPGRAFGGETALAVTIDAVIDKDEQGQYRVTVPEGRMPSLGISQYYRKMLKAAGHDKGATTQYLNEKYQAALWLLKSIDQRKKTLQRVVEAMVDVQRGFFDDGPSSFRPLTLKDIAAVTQLHESTISRVTSGKYAQTPRGIFDLKFFFSGGFKTDSGSDASAPAVKEKLRQLVAEEDPRRPLADQRLADLLKAGGVTIARRTVAKYREELRILPATQRKSVPS